MDLNKILDLAEKEQFICDVCNEEFDEDFKSSEAYEQFGFDNCCDGCYDCLKEDRDE